jgi:site-specific DNA-methyltransferase (adenine-specific)
MKPYFQDEKAGIVLYHGDAREILPTQPAGDCILADPPYGITSLKWDKWPTGWLEAVRGNSLWCFGKLRLFMERGQEFAAAGFKLSHDVIWEKHNGSGFQNDRFRQVHEQIAHFYRGKWSEVQHVPPVTNDATKRTMRRKQRPTHMGNIGARSYSTVDGGPRQMLSVIRHRSEHGRAFNETQKPVELLKHLLSYACPPGGIVIVPFSGAGSELVAAKQLGMRAIGCELREEQCETAAKRLSQEVMTFQEMNG